MHLLPLSEIIATALGVDSPSTQQVWNIYNRLIEKFGNEYTVLIDAPKQALSEVVDQRTAEAILRVREGKIKVIPGYDGVYGRPIIFEEEKPKTKPREKVQQLNLTDFL
jgi:PHP family Zn ribbon phosphoesterase